MAEPIFLSPKFHEKIWGGNKISSDFNFNLKEGNIGEAWVISAHNVDSSTVKNGPLEDKTLKEVWDENPELFGGHDKNESFPLLIKIIDANDDLSVQVHPGDEYARSKGENYGKTESWFVLNAEPESKIYLGTSAKDINEFKEAFNNGNPTSVFEEVPVKKGDFFYVPSGTLHAIGKGVEVLETQQSSDITYRVYDFNRVDKKTHKKRELHLEDAFNVVNIDNKSQKLPLDIEYIDNGSIQTFVQAKYFTVRKIDITKNKFEFFKNENNFSLQTVISGSGELKIGDKIYPLKKGDSFIIPFDIKNFELSGPIEIIQSFVTKKENIMVD